MNKIYRKDIKELLAWAESIPVDELYHEFEVDETHDQKMQLIGNAIGTPDPVPYFAGDLKILCTVASWDGFNEVVDYYVNLWEIPREDVLGCNNVAEDYIDHSFCYHMMLVIAQVLGKEQIYLDAFKTLPIHENLHIDFILAADLRFEDGQPFTAETIRAILAPAPEGVSNADRARLFGA